MSENETIADVIKVPEKTKLESPGVSISDCGKGILQPHVKYKWRISFNGGTNTFYLMPNHVTSCSHPTLEFKEVKTAIGNDSHVYTAVQHSWQPITVSFTDKVDSLAVIHLQKQIQKQHDAFAGKPNDYKFSMHVSLLKPDESILEVWTLTGCFIQAIDYNDLTCPAGQTSINLIIRYDHAHMI